MANRLAKPGFVYVARKNCGCCMGICSDYGDEQTANAVAAFIRDGLAVNRVDWEEYRNTVSKEPGFMNCSHGQMSFLGALNERA